MLKIGLGAVLGILLVVVLGAALPAGWWELVSRSFSDAFYPNLWSTLVGAVLGVATALGLDRLATRRAEQARARARREAQDDLLDSLEALLRQNADSFMRWSRMGPAEPVLLSVVYLDGWVALRREVADVLDDRRLVLDLLRHAEYGRRLYELQRIRATRLLETGKVAAEDRLDHGERRAAQECLKESRNLADKAASLAERVHCAREQLLGHSVQRVTVQWGDL